MRQLINRSIFVFFMLSIPQLTLTGQNQKKFAETFPWRNIGPATMMGRISCIDAYNKDYRVVLIGASSGGIFKSINGGTTFRPIFENYGSQSIGDVAFFQGDTSTIWVGTGEATNRNSVGWGDGIYKSTDGGLSFTHMGLRETGQISEIVPHPTNPDIVYVAAIGRLWGYSGTRGLFKTEDGGKTWDKLTNGLPDDNKTGATVVALDPENPNTVYAGFYQRLRSAWDMQSGGPVGGIFKSADAGKTWKKLTTGLPQGDTGQIDISIHLANPQIVFAYVEASDELPDDLSIPGPGVYRSDDGGESWKFIFRHNSRPYYHGRIRVAPSDPNIVYIVARDFWYSRDGGQSFKRGRPWRGGGDDHDLWIDPENKDNFYMATDQGAYLSEDGGATTVSFNNMAIGQYYAIGVDMRDPYWVYGGLQDNGGWGLPSNSRDHAGILNDHVTVTNGGDGFHMQVDPTDWRTLYTATHVGFFGRQNMATRKHTFITPTPKTTTNFDDYYDPEFKEGQTNYSINPEEAWLWRDIPNRTINGAILPPQFRWNWNSPLVLSPTNPRTLYVGSSNLFKSTDRGETWRIISPDLTTNDPAKRNSANSGGLTKDATGAENHCTIYTIDESVLDASIIWVGTDDGNIQVTRNGGATWKNVRPNLKGPARTMWVSRVEASKHDKATAYVTLDGHWMDDYAPYIFKTDDFGKTWKNIGTSIPHATPGNSIHTVIEDRINKNLLFAGTEFGCYYTIDGGISWQKFMKELPSVAVHDLVIHPRENDLVAGTHGRSIWIADDISPLQQLTDAVLAKDVHMFNNKVATKWLNFSKGRIQNYFKFRGPNPARGAAINFYVKAKPKSGAATIEIADLYTGQTRLLKTKVKSGINRIYWDMRFFPDAAELEKNRSELATMHSKITDIVSGPAQKEHLQQMKKDLLAIQRYPGIYKEMPYPDKHDAKKLLLTHLGHIQTKLNSAESYRHLHAVREQLLAFSQVVGDDAFFGFYGKALRATEAAAGNYRVILRIEGASYESRIAIREDPILTAEKERSMQ